MVVSDQHLIERKNTKYNIEWVKLITPGAWWTVVIVNGRMLLLSLGMGGSCYIWSFIRIWCRWDHGFLSHDPDRQQMIIRFDHSRVCPFKEPADLL